jgi:hypothetical protein
VRDNYDILDYEDFESASVGDKGAGIWHADVGKAFGLYSGLVTGLEEKDPFNDNFTTQVVFFMGSTYPSSEYPGLFDTPFCKGPGGIEGPCHNEMIVSPVLDMKKHSPARRRC